MGLLTQANVATDKAIDARDKNFTRAKIKRRLGQIDNSAARYLSQLDTADWSTRGEDAASQGEAGTFPDLG